MNPIKSIAVIGLGYVGLPLAIEFGKKFKTIGYDTDLKRIKNLKNNIDSNKEISSTDIIGGRSTGCLVMKGRLNTVNKIITV